MLTEIKPFDYGQLRNYQKDISALKTSKVYRKEEVYWHLEWEKELKSIYELINKELEK
jgi:hypothetical protein